jgi:microcystin-dependent protein
MAQPYVGEIRIFAGNFAPAGWALCEGQLLQISQNTALFQLIGTTYGGDGETTFALPDLRGRLPIHKGSNQGVNFVLGEQGGVEDVTLAVNQIASHSHPMLGSTNTSTSPQSTNNVVGKSTQLDLFINAVPGDPLSANAITPVGGSQPHTNFQPYLCVDFIISLFGIFPTQN